MEHLLSFSVSADGDTEEVWRAFYDFIQDPPLTQTTALFEFTRLFWNHVEGKQILDRSLELQREEGEDLWILISFQDRGSRISCLPNSTLQ